MPGGRKVQLEVEGSPSSGDQCMACLVSHAEAGQRLGKCAAIVTKSKPAAGERQERARPKFLGTPPYHALIWLELVPHYSSPWTSPSPTTRPSDLGVRSSHRTWREGGGGKGEGGGGMSPKSELGTRSILVVWCTMESKCLGPRAYRLYYPR